jgi:biotin transport system substrate-specific component
MRNPRLRNLILAGLFAALAAVVARFSFNLPMTTVPVTLQVLVVLLAGGLLEPGWAAAALLLYVLLGLVGLPVYSGGHAGLGWLLGPTGGYLLSYPVAAALVGLVAPASRAPALWRTVAGMLLGLIAIYAGGGGWAVLWGGKAMAVVVNGWVLPFVPFDLVKLGLAAVLANAVNRALAAQGYWGR